MTNIQLLKQFLITKISTAFKINLLGAAYAARGIGLDNNGNNNGEYHFLKNVLPGIVKTQSPTCIDVGGNTGYYSNEILTLFPNAQIHIFEPNLDTFDLLQENMKENTGVSVNNIALGKKDKEIEIFTYQDQKTSGHTSMYSGVFEDMHKNTNFMKLNATQTTLDGYCEEKKISKIDFLKIDVEGHEYEVLQGSKNLIKNKSIKVIQFEFNHMNVVSRVFLRDFYKFLSDYEFFRLLPNKLLPLGEYNPVNEVFRIHNIVAVRKV